MGIPFEQILIQTVNGLVNGMILALVASGLTLIFGIMDVVNFAHGDLVMLGGFVGAATIAATGNFWLALLAAALTIGRLRGGPAGDDAPPAPRARPPHDDPGHLRHLARPPEVRDLAVGADGPSDPGARDGPVRALLPAVPLVPHPDRRPVRRHHRRALPVPQARQVRRLDPGDHAGPGDGARRWASRCRSCTRRCSPSAPPWPRRAASSSARSAASPRTMGVDFTLRAFIVVVVGGMGNLGGLDPGRDLHQPARGLRRAGGQPGPGRHRVLRGADPHLLVRPTGLFVPTPK